MKKIALTVFLSGVLASHFTAISFGREVKVKGPVKEITAHVVPAKDWCANVVSAELRGPRNSFLEKPEDVQRLVAGLRIGVLEDCPEAEIIRFRGVDKKDSLFLAYTEKASDWGIIVAESDKEMLAVLKLNPEKEESVRKIALLETQSHMARVGIQNVVYDTRVVDQEDVRLNWRLDQISGSTFLTFERAKKFTSISELADVFSNASIGECESVDKLSQDSLPSGIEVRSFDCVSGTETAVKMVLVIEINNISTTYIMSSQDKDTLIEFNRLLANEKVLY